MKIIKKAERIETKSYSLDFDWDPKNPGHGLGFECDEHGNVDKDKLHPAARANFEACLSGVVKGKPVYRRLQKYVDSYREPAVGLCDGCGREVELHGFTNTCDCGLDYNGAGQQLAPRSQWGEETGETAADILMVDYDPGC